MDCSSGDKYIFKITSRGKCPESTITIESPPILNEAGKQAFILKVTETIIQTTTNPNFVLNYDPSDLTPIFTFDIGIDNFIVTLGENPMIYINNVSQLISPNNTFSYEYFDSFGNLRKKNFTFYNGFFTLKDEDSSLVYYSDLRIFEYQNFDL